jgi:phosphoribosylamine--glycine ligase
MRVLLIGDGAMEHALSEHLARSSELYVAMEKDNPGIAAVCQKRFICEFSNIEAIGSWAIKEKIDAALVTSERALAKGVVDALEEAGVKSASAPSSGSMIGENRAYSYNLMESAGIARPEYRICNNLSDIRSAAQELERFVMKPSVRVEWKGTKFTDIDMKTKASMEKEGKAFIKRHGSVILERMIDGESFTVQGFTDGRDITVGPPVQTVKRALEDDEGPLTPGMGGYSAGRLLPFMGQEDLEYARSALLRLVTAIRKKGIDYRGPIRGEFITSRGGPLMIDAYATLGEVATLNNFLVLKTQMGDVVRSIIERNLVHTAFIENATVVKYLTPLRYPAKTKRKGEIVVDDRVLWNNGSKAYVHSVEMKDGNAVITDNRTMAICARGELLPEANVKVEGSMVGVSGRVRHRKDIASRNFVNRAIKHMALIRRR